MRDFFTSSSIVSVIDLMFIGVFLGLLYMIVGELALVPLLAVPVVLVATLLIQVPLARSVNAAQLTKTSRHTILVESMVGIETVKADRGRRRAAEEVGGRGRRLRAGQLHRCASGRRWRCISR